MIYSEVDMCKGMEEYMLQTKVEIAIGLLKDMIVSEEEIIRRISEKFEASAEYVKTLMMPQAV